MFLQAAFSDSVLSGSSYGPPVLSGSKASLPELETSPYHCKWDQILVRLQEEGSRGANSFLCFLLVSYLPPLLPVTGPRISTKRISGRIHVGVGGWGVTHSVIIRAEPWRGQRREGGRAAAVGAPGTWNVNWEDCFNKALIFANAGRGLAAGGGHTGGRAAHSQILSANNVK